MKRSICFLLLTASFFISACQRNDTALNPDISSSSIGTVSVVMPSSGVPPEVQGIFMRLERSGSTPITDSVSVAGAGDTLRISVRNVPTGNWTITLTAFDAQRITRYRGTAPVNVIENFTTLVPIQMQQVAPTGIGNIIISVTWQTNSGWRFFNQNPILSPSGTDGVLCWASSVIKVGNEYKMFYRTGNGPNIDGSHALALATSPDGRAWTKRGIVLRGEPNNPTSIRSMGVLFCSVLYENNEYKMWFTAASSSVGNDGIGYATSPDGINWTVRPSLVIAPSSTYRRIFAPSVIKRGNEYFMYYSADPSSNWELTSSRIVLSRSSDGITWSAPTTVLQSRGLSWENGLYYGNVVLHNGRYEMLYCTSGSQTPSVGRATSTDGLTWAFASTTPELTGSNSTNWQINVLGTGGLLSEDGILKFWFLGFTNNLYYTGLTERVGGTP
jgi:predicted GH43/DUF377 family glycosyl hydrolase